MDSRPRLLDALKRVAQEFGFDHVSLMSVPGADDTMLAPLVIGSTLSSDFVREFDKHQYLRQCPVIPRIVGSLMPQRWSLKSEADLQGFVFPEGMIRLLHRYNLISSVMTPVNSLSGERYLLRFDGTGELIEQIALNELNMLCLEAFDVFDRLVRSESSPPRLLTKRELEVVRWTAQGKTSVEIGQILSLSDHTINAYMNNAIKKLDCVNRTQLVAKAIRLKIIS